MFSNVWVVSIGSTFIVSILGWAIKVLWGRHHSQKTITEANLYAERFLRNLCLNYSNIDITRTLINSVLDSAARKFDVSRVKNLNSVDETIDDLILKILETDFVDKDQKSESVKKIIKLSLEKPVAIMNNDNTVDEQKVSEAASEVQHREGLKSSFQDRFKLLISYEIIMFTVILGVVMIVLTFSNRSSYDYEFNAYNRDSLMVVMIISVLTALLFTLILLKRMINRKKK